MTVIKIFHISSQKDCKLSPQRLWNATSVHVCQLRIHFSCSVSCHRDKTVVFDLIKSVWFLDLQTYLETLPYSLHMTRKTVSNTSYLQFSCFPFPNKSVIHLLLGPVYVIWGRHLPFTPKWVASWSPNHVRDSAAFLHCFALFIISQFPLHARVCLHIALVGLVIPCQRHCLLVISDTHSG